MKHRPVTLAEMRQLYEEMFPLDKSFCLQRWIDTPATRKARADAALRNAWEQMLRMELQLLAAKQERADE